MEIGNLSPKVSTNGDDAFNSPLSKKPKTNENKYPGLSFILFVKSLPGSDISETWFECILCALESRMVPKEMTVHLRSSKHLYNLMGVECPKFLGNFTEDGDSQKMLKCILEYESSRGTSQIMTAAHPENVATKRTEVMDQINTMKQSYADAIKQKALQNNEWEDDEDAVTAHVIPLTTGNFNWENDDDDDDDDDDDGEKLLHSQNTPKQPSPKDHIKREQFGEEMETYNNNNRENKLTMEKASDEASDEIEKISNARTQVETSEEKQKYAHEEELPAKRDHIESEDDDDEDKKVKLFEELQKNEHVDEEEISHHLKQESSLEGKSVDMSNYEMFQKGFQGKQFIMNTFENLNQFVREKLRFTKNHVYFGAIEVSYLSSFVDGKITKSLMKVITAEELGFLRDSMNSLYLDHEVLSYRHKPILPVMKVLLVCQKYHDTLHHPNAITLFEIISREFLVFPAKTLAIIERICQECIICLATPEELSKAHSYKVLEAYNEWPNKREVKALNFNIVTNMSYSRNPTRIVIIGDERDEALKSMNLSDVSVRICPGLNLENAFDFISCDASFGQGVLFVVLCGTFTFVRWEVDKECLKKGCPEPLLIPSVVQLRECDLYTYAVNAARNLHQSVMLNSQKDDVVFGHVLPIALNSNAKFLACAHQRKFGHKSNHPLLRHPQKEFYISLNIAMLNYNGWTDRFACQLGYCAWNISAGFFAEVVQNSKRYHKFNLGKLKEDGVHFTSITQDLRVKMVTELCKETLTRLHNKEKNGLLKNFVSMENPLITRTLTGHRFDKILIFCESDSKILLQNYSSSQVLITDAEVIPSVIEGLCMQYNLKSTNTLWIFTSSVRPIAQRLWFEGCPQNRSCNVKMPFLAPRNDLVVSNKATQKGIKDVINNVMNIIEMTKSIVGPKCVAIVAPALPVTIVNADFVKHDSLHRLFNSVPQVFVSNNAAIKKLLPLYDSFRESSIELAKDLFRKQGLYPIPLIEFKPRIKGSFRTLGTKQTHFPFIANEWQQMMKNLIYTCLNGFPVNIPQTVEDRFMENHLTPNHLDRYKKQNVNLRFNRVVFIGSKQLDEILTEFTSPLIQVINIDFDEAESEIATAMEKIQALPGKSLCIYISDASIITDQITSSAVCELNHCLSSFDCSTLKNKTKFPNLSNIRMVEEVVKLIHTRLTTIADAINGSSFFIVSPLCPVRGFLLASYPNNMHIKLHTYNQKKRYFEFLDGERRDWVAASEALDKLWSYVMESFKPNIGVPYKTIIKYDIQKEGSFQLLNHLVDDAEEFFNVSAWKSTLVTFIDLCLKMRKDGKFIEKLLTPSIQAPPAPPDMLLSVMGQALSSSSEVGSMMSRPLPPPPIPMGPSLNMPSVSFDLLQGPGQANIHEQPMKRSSEIRLPIGGHDDQFGPRAPDPMHGPQGPVPPLPPPPMHGGLIPPPLHGSLPPPPRPMHGPLPPPPRPLHGPLPPPPPGPMSHQIPPQPAPMPGPLQPPPGLPLAPRPPIPMPVMPGQPPIPMPVMPGQPPIPMPVMPGQPPIPMPVMPGQPPIPMPVMPGQPPIPMPVMSGQPPTAYYPQMGLPNYEMPAIQTSSAFPGPQTYSYPVPNLSTSKPTPTQVLQSQKAKIISKAPVKFNISTTTATKTTTTPTATTTITSTFIPEILSNKEEKTDYRVLIGKIDASISDLDLNMMMSIIGDFILFERPKVSASYGVAKFLTKEGAERCVRLLDNYPLKPGPIEVRFLYYRDVQDEKLGISVMKKDADILKLLKEVLQKLKLGNEEDSIVLKSDDEKASIEIIDKVPVANIPEPEKPAEIDSKEKVEESKKPAFTFKYSMAPVDVDVEKDGKKDDEKEEKKEMAQSQANKLTDYLKKKKVTAQERSKSRELPSRKGRYRSRTRSRSRSRSRPRSRSRSRSSSRSRSYSKSKSRSPARGRYFPRGARRPYGFRGRRDSFPYQKFGGNVRPPIPRRPKSPPKDRKAKDSLADSYHLISSEEEFLDDVPKMYEIRITNIPLLITVKFLNDVVIACGSPTPCKRNERGPGFLAQFHTLKRATMVAQHLNKWRVIDKVLKVDILADTKEAVDKISMVEDTAVAKEIESVFVEYKETFIIKIQGEIMKDPDIFTFKIFKCGVQKCREYDCHYYHNPFDRRRDYLEFKYSERMCAHARDNIPCPRGEYCNMCHNQIERIFHPKNYKTNICLDWYDLKRCPRKGFCAKSHPLNPDSFFTEAWKDCFVAGLDQSYFFFAGAIKQLYKVPDNEGGIPIVFITTMPDVAKLASEVAKPVARIHRLKIAIITDDCQDPGGAHILIGTPSGLASLVESKGSAPLGGLRVVIMDDISTLINNPHHQHHLKYLIEAIFSEVGNKKLLCKVALSETCHPSEISKVEEFLGSNLTLFNPHRVDANLLPAVVTTPSVPSTSGKESSTTRRPTSVSLLKPDEDLSDWEGGKEDKTSVVSSKAKIPSKRRERSVSSKSNSSGSSSSSRSSSRSSRSSSRSRSRGRKRKRSNSSNSDKPSKGEYSTFTSGMLAKMKQEESVLLKEHGAAYEVYLEVPEMHPNYEDKYERFLLSYKKKYNTTNESEHMTKMWQKYWKLCIENIKSKDWTHKRRDLLEKYKLETSIARSSVISKSRSRSRTPPPKKEIKKENPPTMSSAAVVAAISEISRQPLDNFTVAGAVDLLEELSDCLGDIKESALSLLSSVRSSDLSKKAAMDMISKEENILLMNMIFEKILIMSQTMSGPKAEFYKKGIAWGLHLIKFAKDFKEGEEMPAPKDSSMRFDLHLFAQQTYNHEPSWIYETLEQSLEYVYGAKPSTDIMKQMFANVSAIHLNMSSSTPYLMSGASSSSDLNNSNPGIVSQDEAKNPPVPSNSKIPLTPLIPPSSESFVSSYSSYPQLPTPLVHAAAAGLQMTQTPVTSRTKSSTPTINANVPPPTPETKPKPVPHPVQPPSIANLNQGGSSLNIYNNSSTAKPSLSETLNSLVLPTENPQPPPPNHPPTNPPPPPPPPQGTPPPPVSSYPSSFLSYHSPQASSSTAQNSPGSIDMVNTIMSLAKHSTHQN